LNAGGGGPVGEARSRYQVPVTGSCTWRDAHAVEKALDALAAAHPGVSLRHGGCPSGADRFTELWCRARQIIPERYKAEWGRLGRKVAGPVRNQRMVDSAPDECLAFIDPCSDPRCRRPWPTARTAPSTAPTAPKPRASRPSSGAWLNPAVR
jgi:hypothetical protein